MYLEDNQGSEYWYMWFTLCLAPNKDNFNTNSNASLKKWRCYDGLSLKFSAGEMCIQMATSSFKRVRFFNENLQCIQICIKNIPHFP